MFPGINSIIYVVQPKKSNKKSLRMSRSYGIVRNINAACWWWLLQMWKFVWFACVRHIGFNLFARWHPLLWFKR